MTYEQFWEMDCQLVKAYRKAFRIRQEQENRYAWLQGMYIYDALSSVPIVVSGFAKPGQTKHRYPTEPYKFDEPEPKRAKGAKEAESKYKGQEAYAMAMMQMYAQSINRKFSKDNG